MKTCPHCLFGAATNGAPCPRCHRMIDATVRAPFNVVDATRAIDTLRKCGLLVIQAGGSDTAFQLLYRARLSLEAKIAAYLAADKDTPEAPGCPWCEVSAPNHNAGCPAETLDQIAAILDGTEWDCCTPVNIAAILRDTGRTVRDLDDNPEAEYMPVDDSPANERRQMGITY